MNQQLLRRRGVLAGFAAILAAGISSGVAAGAEPPTFYVSGAGTDDADGLTPQTAWATIQHVNAQIPAGSRVLFRRDDTFFGELAPPLNCEVGAFGAGARPVLTMYKLLNRPNGWVEHSPGIWKVDLGNAETHGGYTSTSDANIGFLLIDGFVKAARRQNLSELAAAWEFWCDTAGSTLYVAATGNPAKIAGEVKAAPRGVSGRIISCTRGANEIHDIHITGTGGHGICGAATDVHIHDCLVDYVGGSYLPGFRDGATRYGNGIENGIGAKRWTIENNEIAQVYDAGYTCQGSAYDRPDTWEDMTIRANHFHDCTQTFEFWSTGTNPNAGFKRVRLTDNLCERAGYSDFADLRPDQAQRVQLLTYEWDLPADIIIENNNFVGAATAYSFLMTVPTGLVTRNNVIRLKAGTKLQYQSPETVDQAIDWKRATGLETGSSITGFS